MEGGEDEVRGEWREGGREANRQVGKKKRKREEGRNEGKREEGRKELERNSSLSRPDEPITSLHPPGNSAVDQRSPGPRSGHNHVQRWHCSAFTNETVTATTDIYNAVLTVNKYSYWTYTLSHGAVASTNNVGETKLIQPSNIKSLLI